jgi:hypothetical protein
MATPTLLQEAATLVDTSFDELPILYAVLSLASACVNSPAFLYVDSHFIGWPIPSATSRSLMRSSWALFARPALSRDSSTVSRWAAFSLSLCTPHPCAPDCQRIAYRPCSRRGFCTVCSQEPLGLGVRRRRDVCSCGAIFQESHRRGEDGGGTTD